MKKMAASLLFLSLLVSGCAYFNTFYNAKQFYKKGYAETRKNFTDKPGNTEKNFYEEAINRSLTLIVDYPNSKYVDDALVLAGKSYYYRQEYFNAKRKFLELLTNYPESPFVDEARLWMARTQLALDEYKEAEELVNTLVSEDISENIKGQAYYYLGKFHERKRNFDQAVTAFQNALKYGVEDQLAGTYFAMGTSLDTLGRYEEARDAFGEVPKATVLKELEFRARFSHARMNKMMGKTDEALEELQTLLADEENAREVPNIKLQIASSYEKAAKTQDAIDAYDEIIRLHENTVQAAEAYYRIGGIYESVLSDYDKALDNYLEVKKTSSRSVYADTAEIYARDIQRLKALTRMVVLGKKGESGDALLVGDEDLEEDSLTLELAYDRMDTTKGDTARYKFLTVLGGKIFADSVFREKNKSDDERQRELDLNLGMEKQVAIDWREWLEDDDMPSYSAFENEFPKLQERKKRVEKPDLAVNPLLSTYRVEELDRNLFLLAELYLFRFEKPDSAFNQYDTLIRELPESPYTPGALYNMAHLYETHYNNPEQVRLTYQALAEEYGSSPYANAARIRLGLPAVPTRQDSISILFRQAETALFDENIPVKALELYDEIWTRFNDTPDAVRAWYAKGYVYETFLDSLGVARTVYDSLMSWFPESPYTQRVRPKMEAVLNPVVPGGTAAGTDSSEVLSDSLQQGAYALADSAADSGDGMLASADPGMEPGGRSGFGRKPGFSNEEDRPGSRRLPFRLDVMARIRQQQRLMQIGQREAKRPEN